MSIAFACFFGACSQRADLEKLSSAFRSSDPVVQQEACTDAAALGAKAMKCLPELIKLLKATDPTTRRLAAYAIQEIGRAAESAVNPLKSLLADTNRDVAVSAANTLNRIAPNAAPIEVGDVYWKRFQEPDPALPCYKRAANLNPKNPLPYRRLAEVQQWLGQKEEAKQNEEIAERLAASKAAK